MPGRIFVLVLERGEDSPGVVGRREPFGHPRLVAVVGGGTNPYPSLSVTTPSFPEQSPLESGSAYRRRLKKFRKDNAKWAGQRRAIERLEVKPKKIEVPQIPK